MDALVSSPISRKEGGFEETSYVIKDPKAGLKACCLVRYSKSLFMGGMIF